MRFKAMKAFGGAGVLLCASVVTLATGRQGSLYGGSYDVESTCAGFQETGILKVYFYSQNQTAPSKETTPSPSPSSSAPLPPATRQATVSPKSEPPAVTNSPAEGTAIGAKAFGFPNERFTSTRVEPTYVFESSFNGKTCRAVDPSTRSETLAFLCRDDVTKDILCRITLTKKSIY
ncbi:MAG: hypothetical protein IOD12_02600 [Silvanigrellales bacterium]|nr:hypothetical protein [Silvanigrellales bacterium]